MKLKSTIDLVKSYPQMLMKPMLRQVKNACFLMLRLKFHQIPVHFSEEVAALLGISIEDTKSNEFTNIFSGKNCYPIPVRIRATPDINLEVGRSIRRRASYYPAEKIKNKFIRCS
jgi:hypothetical protein